MRHWLRYRFPGRVSQFGYNFLLASTDRLQVNHHQKTIAQESTNDPELIGKVEIYLIGIIAYIFHQ